MQDRLVNNGERLRDTRAPMMLAWTLETGSG